MPVRVLSSICVAILCAGFAGPALAGTAGDEEGLRAKIDGIFAPWDKADSPGCVVAIYKDGELLHQRGYGMADLASGTAIDKETVFDIGSMTKQFTAASIVLLAERGAISLDDPVSKCFPAFTGKGGAATIRHLLHHTSGIRDYAWLMLLARMEFGDVDVAKTDEIMSLLARQKELYFAPGDASHYSNSNYLLLGAIVQGASGQSLRAFAQENLFGPLGMTHTAFVDGRSQMSAKLATGYVRDRKGAYHAKPVDIMFGAGGVQTTVEDMALWLRNFDESRIGGSDFVTTMETPGALNDGKPAPFACGLEVKAYRGLKTIGHKGFTESFATYAVRFPEQDFAVICLGNTALNPDRLAMQVADVVLADALEPLPPEPPRPQPAQRTVAQVDPAIYDRYAGGYRFDFGLMMTFVREGDTFLMKADKQPTVELFPESETTFFMKQADIQVRFDTDDGGAVTGMTMVQSGRPMQARRVGASGPIPAERLAGYAGSYFNDELDVTYHVALEDGGLVVRAPREFESALRHVEDETFATSRGDMQFRRDAAGAVAGYELEVKTERLRFTFEKR